MQDNSRDKRSGLALAGAAVAVFFTAFELKQPIVPLGFVNFTTTEVAGIFLYVTSILWARQVGLASYLKRRSLDLAVFVFVFCNFLSVLAAEDKPSALKFALRMTEAALVYVAISRLPQQAKSHLLIARALTVALMIVTAFGLLSNFFPVINWLWVLSPFQEAISTFGAFYNVRVSSTLPFPTTLSMYLELATPVALVLGIRMLDREKANQRRLWLTIAVVVVLAGVMTVQVFTFTRTALVAAPVSMLAGAVLAAIFGYGRRVWLLFVAGAVLLVAVTGAATLLSSKMSSRLDITKQEQFYGAEYRLLKFPDRIALNEHYSAAVNVKNTGSITWKGEGDDSVFLGYRWLTYPDRTDQKVVFEQSYPNRNVPSGGDIDLNAGFFTPSDPGKYVLIFDLVQSHVSWFSGAFVPPLVVPVEFDANGVGRTFTVPEPASDFVAAEPEQFQASRTELWDAAIKLWKKNVVLGVGPDQFRHRYLEVAPDLPPDPRLETHNIFIQALVDTGVVGLLGMVFLLGSALWVQFGLVRDRQLTRFERNVSLALIVALIAYITHGMLDFFLWQSGIAFLFFAMLGLTSWMKERAKRRGRFRVL